MSSSAPYEGQLCCAICGDAILPHTAEPTEATRWQREAVLLSDPAREFEQLEEHYRGGKRRNAPRLDLQTTQEIQKDRAHVIEGDRLCIITANEEDGSESGLEQEEIVANFSYGRGENGEWASTLYSIATHESCLEVAETVICCSPHEIAVRDLRTLWKVLRMRFEVDDNYYMSTVIGDVVRPQRIQLPHGYYMPFRPSQMMPEFSPHGSSSAAPVSTEGQVDRWEAADPLRVLDVTSAILENLKTLPPARNAAPQAVAFQKQFLALPPELRDHICSLLVSRNGMPIVCNGLLPQWVWREVLLSGECLPFMPKLEVAIVENFCIQWDREHTNQEPNWELLVRKLSQEAWSVWDAESSSLKVPNGLRNRRRIWQLVEEMYVGDLVPMKRTTQLGNDTVAVPRYWDQGGKPVYPVTRVNAGPIGGQRSTMVATDDSR
ncbi:hypothetical protein F4677DRAFT_434097 [Hypoxylon crocopeplum]|nr:hypothetical protein F4677DRAFT_434097 [Hypoxylon crocopeplum]